MTDSIKYSCLVDGYTARELFSGSTLLSMEQDLQALVHIAEANFKSKRILTLDASAKLISQLDSIFYFHVAFFAQFESFTEQDRIKSDFRDLPILKKLEILKERLHITND